MSDNERLNDYLDGKITTTDGSVPKSFDTPAPAPIGPNGQHESYWVLSASERAKGFVRPVRQSYRHVGRPGPTHPLRDLTDEEREHFRDVYVKFEEYPEPRESSALGRFWTQADLDGGCGTVTTMGRALAETYARDPQFYGATMCVGCGTHLRVGADGEFVWVENGQDTERVGT